MQEQLHADRVRLGGLLLFLCSPLSAAASLTFVIETLRGALLPATLWASGSVLLLGGYGLTKLLLPGPSPVIEAQEVLRQLEQ